ncbi:UNVERIFIED_CONTAM: hypothetical protein GTU68_014918 [Idotea baltica]|nr:hypothetical protein [Idotea baltica]
MHYLKGLQRFIILGLSVLLLQCTSERSNEHVIRVSLWVNEQHTWFKSFEYFRDILLKRTDGRLKLEVYPSEQLAKEVESIRLIQADVIDMTVTGSVLSNWIEIAAFCELPFFLRNSEEKDLLINGDLGGLIEHEMLTKTGLRSLGVMERGARLLTSNRPIKHPEDLEGLLVRVPNVPSFVTAWSAMGAKPTPMAFSEVFTSLQQGTIQAQENPYELILSMGFSEVQKYINLTEHVMSWSYPVIGEVQFQRIPKDLQEIFVQAAKEMIDYEHRMFMDNQSKVKQQLLDQGMEIIEVDKAAFSAKCETAIYNSLSPEVQKHYKDFITLRDSVNASKG